MPRSRKYDVAALFRLYHAGLPMDEMAKQLGVGLGTLKSATIRHGLRRRPKYVMKKREKAASDPPSAEQETRGDSLEFSPWVAQRIKELRIGMPQELTT